MAWFGVFYFGKISLTAMVVIKLVHSTSIMCILYGGKVQFYRSWYIYMHMDIQLYPT